MQTPLPEFLTPDLLAYLKKTYRLNWYGVHGWDHWMRVYENGMRIAQQNGADQTVVGLFAFTHDIDRQQEGGDRAHGPAAAKRIQIEMQGRFFTLSDTQLHLLVEAVRLHTAGQTEADKTIQTCWDADRLDLWRAGIRPRAKYLCTPEARDPRTIEWAVERSNRWLRGKDK
jgi:uncharacterized protein